MKQTMKLAALAVACTCPAFAQAQSNVTIYGLLDVNLAQERAGSLKRNAMDTSELNGSRLGFRGTEDLGNGLKAVYTLEAAVALDTGTSSGYTRQSFVGLEGSFGRVTLGRQYSPAFIAIDPYESTGASDRSAGMLHRKTGSVVRGYQVRFDNMIKYRSPEMAGFSIDAGYWTGNEIPSTDGDVRRQGRGYGLTGIYKNGPFATSVTTQSFRSNDTGGRATTHGIGGSYDFGMVKLYALYTQDKESGSQGDGKARSYAVGAEVPVSTAGTVAVSYGNRNESDEAGAEDASGASIYYMHNLSKRTTLYTAYSQINNRGDANYGFNLTPEAGDNAKVVMAGIRHKF